jgi:hypothetical protein
LRAKSVLASALTVLALLSLVLLAGCGPTGPQWIDNHGSYSATSVTNLYAKADISPLSSVGRAEVANRRHDALTGLRRRGGAAAEAADLITRTIPQTSAGIPVYVEKATFDGKASLIIIEAIGPPNGKLTVKRLWVLSDSGSVEFVGTR